jgi:hypothetical protein
MNNMINADIDLNYSPTSDASGIQQPRSTEESAQRDPRLWSTSLTDEVKSYFAQLRILPNPTPTSDGKVTLNGYPSRCIQKHKIRIGNSKYLTAKCLKTNNPDAYCPYCDWAWKRYDMLKKANESNPSAELSSEIKKNLHNLPFEVWASNILLRNDQVHPELNGQVKIWEHSQKVNDIIDYPRNPEEVEKRKAARKKKTMAPAINPLALQQVKRFYPEHPTSGHDFIVSCRESDNIIDGNKRPLATYEGSAFIDDASPIAATREEAIAILNQCVNLNDYAAEGIESVEQAKAHLHNWLSSTSDDVETGADNAQPTGNVPAARANPNVTPVSGAAFAPGYTKHPAASSVSAPNNQYAAQAAAPQTADDWLSGTPISPATVNKPVPASNMAMPAAPAYSAPAGTPINQPMAPGGFTDDLPF